MIKDQYGRKVFDEKDVVDLIYQIPDIDMSNLLIDDPEKFNSSNEKYWREFSDLQKYQPLSVSPEEFDEICQSNWYMPKEYQDLDIAAWILSQCRTQEQLQRCGEELLLYQERNLMPLLKYLKYFADTMKSNGVVCGVGRGSSVASYVLYLMEVHLIDSMYYDLDIKEFLK
jgi:hypothetical protein